MTTTDTSLPEVLETAWKAAQQQVLGYAGSVPPAVAWQLVQQQLAVLVDVRSGEQRHFVGHVPGSIHVPWATGTALTRNPRFVRELEARLAAHGGKEAVALLLCRSGKRSVLAAQAAEAAGFRHVFNVQEGFEGELDAQQQRGHGNGWRYHKLPWVQD